MNILSTFDGMRCGMLASERAELQIDNYFASEVDKYALEIANKNYPSAINLGDVTKWESWNLPKIDLLIGGSPCQGFSRSGKGLNFDDARSKLFFEFVNILNHHRPRYFLLENVDMKKEWEDVITEYLGVEPIYINSSLVSAQKRPRSYWTNIPDVTQPEDKQIQLLDILLDDVDDKYYKFRTDEKNLFKYLENELRIKQATKKGYDIATYGDSINISNPNSTTRRGRVGKQKANTLDTSCNQAAYVKIYKDLRIKREQLKSGCLTGGANSGGNHSDMDLLIFEDSIIRRYTPIECERLQTLPDNYTKGVSDTQRYKMLGNGWTVDVIAHILSFIPKQEIIIDSTCAPGQINIYDLLKST